MSKISVDLNALFRDDAFLTPGSGQLLSTINKHIELDDSGANFDLSGRAYEVTATTSFDLADLSGYKTEAITLGTARLVIVHIVKTAETVSGTFAIASTPLGISSGTITLTSDAQAAAALVGEVLESYIFYSRTGRTNGSGNDLTITLGTPVGFKAEVLIVGDFD